MTTTEMAAAPRPDIGRLLRPRSIAIVGASATPGALGASVLGNLERNGFAGDIHLINPKRSEIAGAACLASVDQLPEGVDVAVLAIPQPFVLDTVAHWRRRVGAAVIFSAGFAEAGERGMAEQREIARIAAEAGMVVEGPNCLGCINYLQRVPLTFVEVNIDAQQADATRPAIGVVSQSGAMMTVLCTTLASRALPLSHAISTGNEAASHAEDYVDFLLEQPSTRVVAMIVEQIRQPARILAAVARARSLGKSVVLLHPGKSTGARSAATHTGAMAGDYALMRTKLERAGAVFAETLEELGDIAEIAIRCPVLPSLVRPLQPVQPLQRELAVLGESGAFKAVTLDWAEELGLALPAIGDDDSPALRAALPEFVGVSNPLDLTAQGLVEPDLYFRTLDALFGDARFSTVLVGLIQGDPVTCGIKMPPVLRAVRELRPAKPVIVAGLDEGAAVPAEFIAEMRALGVPYFPSTERALRAVQRLTAFSQRSFERTDAQPVALTLPAGRTVVPEYESKAVLAQAGIPFARGRLATSAEQAVAIASEIGWPVALKAQSADLSHKSDAGGVILNIADAQAMGEAWGRLHANVAAYDSAIALDGVLIEAMGQRGLEMIIGARNDPQWGPVILAGLGGVTAEIIAMRACWTPTCPPARCCANWTACRPPLLHGYRGAPALDRQALAELIVRLGQVLRGTPAIREIDLNPVIVLPEGLVVVALDALMLVEHSAG
uniref:Feruloyl-CoA synthetase n=1 Tax=Delftia acidovorans TaxID=80866 RepID=Q8VNW6_DELAC|nr:feruloyl-CoA synthetase [Delftia acidovorans]